MWCLPVDEILHAAPSRQPSNPKLNYFSPFQRLQAATNLDQGPAAVLSASLAASMRRYAEYLYHPHPPLPVGLPINQPTIQIQGIIVRGISALPISPDHPPVVTIMHAYGLITSNEADLASSPPASSSSMAISGGGGTAFNFRSSCLVSGDVQVSLVSYDQAGSR